MVDYGDHMSDMAQARRRRFRPLLRTLFGEALRRTRLAQHRTLADVARDARVSVPYLSEVERGRKEASSEVLAAVCDALRIELSDLLAEVRRELVAERAQVVSLATTRRLEDVAAPPARRPDSLMRQDFGAPPRRPGEVVLLAA